MSEYTPCAGCGRLVHWIEPCPQCGYVLQEDMNECEKIFEEWLDKFLDKEILSDDWCWKLRTGFKGCWQSYVEPLRSHNKIIQEMFNDSLKRIKELEECLSLYCGSEDPEGL